MFYRNEITETNIKSSRIHYPWHALEEYQPDGGMWATPPASDRDHYVRETSDLMSNPAAFEASMRRALTEWPTSVAQALTTPGMNHRAWLGHAGCFLATGSPEETTRLGWHDLDDREQYQANAAADRVIAEWRTANAAAALDSRDVDEYQLDMFAEVRSA
jgi:hypothetical protein